MLVQTFLFLGVLVVVEAVDIFANYPELKKCVLTYKMFDASGKLPSGITSGNYYNLGNFDYCLNIDEKNDKGEIIKGKYCVVEVTLPADEEKLKLFGNALSVLTKAKQKEVEPGMIIHAGDSSNGTIQLTLGWCIPHTCAIGNLSIALSSIFQEIDPKIEPFWGGTCQTKEDLNNDYNAASITLMTFLAATVFLMIISTVYDMYIQHYKIKPVHIIFTALSVKTNGQKLLSVSNNPDHLPCLNGIRFLSMLWIIYIHRYGTTLKEPVMNAIELNNWKNNPVNNAAVNTSLPVDTFFVLSGLLVAYGYCLAKDKGIKFHIILFYLHRYLRLTPVLAVVIWIHATIIGYFGSGPFWPFVSAVKNRCIRYWWATLVYAQNYYTHKCIGPAWYLAVDMQLYILSPIILIPLWKWPQRTLLASAVLVLVSIATSFAITYVHDIPVLGGSVKYFNKYYAPTHTRYGPWLMGLMLGFYLFKLKKDRHAGISLPPALVACGWTGSLGLLLSALAAASEHGKLGNCFYNGFARHGWALGVCWLIYACTQGYGGPVNTFLSWPLFQILGRFSYTLYLVHCTVLDMKLGTTRTSSYFSLFHVMNEFWGDFYISLPISVFLTFAYETPMITIEKVVFNRGAGSKEPALPLSHNFPSSEAQTNEGLAGDKSESTSV